MVSSAPSIYVDTAASGFGSWAFFPNVVDISNTRHYTDYLLFPGVPSYLHYVYDPAFCIASLLSVFFSFILSLTSSIRIHTKHMHDCYSVEF